MKFIKYNKLLLDVLLDFINHIVRKKPPKFPSFTLGDKIHALVALSSL